MSSDLERIIQRDLDQLPLFPAERWVPTGPRRTAIGARVLQLVAAGVLVIAAVMVGTTLARIRSDSAPTQVATPPAASGGLGDLSATFDATPEYPGYQWTRDGRPVTPEELGTSAGPAHCGWQSATLLGIGWPPGTHSASAAQLRQYVRDPRGSVRAGLRDRLGRGVVLPTDARPTGYRYGQIEVFLSPTDQDEAIYLVGPSAVERWPRADPMALCS